MIGNKDIDYRVRRPDLGGHEGPQIRAGVPGIGRWLLTRRRVLVAVGPAVAWTGLYLPRSSRPPTGPLWLHPFYRQLKVWRVTYDLG